MVVERGKKSVLVSRRWVALGGVTVALAVGLQVLLVQWDLPVRKVLRNLLSSSTPAPLKPRYACGDLSKEVTVVVTVKDACSQMPGFVAALRPVVGPETTMILTYPNFQSCDPRSLGVDVDDKKVVTIALPPHSSPMVGWLEAAEVITTPYALLLHNDGYALDDFFACELVGALKKRENESYVVAAPMLFESKADGSLAAHATQSRLRVVDGVVRHDHSIAKALNRGADLGEGDQVDFLEDHGFLIKTSAIPTVIDPSASYTLEYIDMILSLKSHDWKVIFVPTARLEFRIADFSWRDVPYFMYKRSEATCHGTRDYLAKKWQAKFPNTGFWTYIKYTIVEDHRYDERELTRVPWAQQAALAAGFFQMAGYNRYTLSGGGGAGAVGGAVGESPPPVTTTTTYVDLLQKLDDKDSPDDSPKASPRKKSELLASAVASRETKRQEPTSVRKAPPAEALLPTQDSRKKWLPSIEADVPLEYLPFAVARVHFPNATCAKRLDDWSEEHFPVHLCGLAVWHQKDRSCDCWVNLPTFKSRSYLVDFLAAAASLVKIPSRVTTYLELVLGASNAASEHVDVLRGFSADDEDLFTFDLHTCGGAQNKDAPLIEPCPDLPFTFGEHSHLVHFSGRPATPKELLDSMRRLVEVHEDNRIIQATNPFPEPRSQP